ncbi:hypothetical protein B0H11DRAFT_2373703 [Mycena galericulata]|nr:hypothetical protein B0H11DRAFT_2373703 [Mycena galericulata]
MSPVPRQISARTSCVPLLLAPPVAAVAQPLPPTTNRFEFAVGSGKKHKRKASIELVPGPPKRANAKPEKVAFHHWVNIGPVNDDTRNPAPAFFKKLLDAATPGYHLPATYIERVTQDPSYQAKACRALAWKSGGGAIPTFEARGALGWRYSRRLPFLVLLCYGSLGCGNIKECYYDHPAPPQTIRAVLPPPSSSSGLVPIFCAPALARALHLPRPPSLTAPPFPLCARFGLPPPFGFQRPAPFLQLLASVAGRWGAPINGHGLIPSLLRAPFGSPWLVRAAPLMCARPGAAPAPPHLSPTAPPLPPLVRFGLPPAVQLPGTPSFFPAQRDNGMHPLKAMVYCLPRCAPPFCSPRLVCAPSTLPGSPASCTAPSRFASLREPRGISPASPLQVSALVAPPFRAYVSFGPAPLPALVQALRPTYPPMQLSHGLCIAYSHLLLAP